MDFVRDVMLVVTTRVDGRDVVIASARYVAQGDGAAPATAEVAFTVEEDYQGNGIAGRLLGHLARLARGTASPHSWPTCCRRTGRCWRSSAGAGCR